MTEIEKIGRVTFRRLTDEDAFQKYCSSSVFVSAQPASLEQAPKAALGTPMVELFPARVQAVFEGEEVDAAQKVAALKRDGPCANKISGRACFGWQPWLVWTRKSS